VARVRETLLTVSVAVALPMTCPGESEVKVTWNWPLALVVPESGLSGMATAPPLLVKVT
jgi:hypothetical protein